MKTARPFSTISYNTEDFLKSKLNKWIDEGKIGFWAYIKHYPEEDEEKEHIHLYIDPEERIDTLQLTNELIEIVPKQPPLRCRPCRNSKFDHWYLYDLHDKDYLESIGQSRKYHYNSDDMICSDTSDLKERIHQIDFTRFSNLRTAIRCAKEGMTLDEFLETHAIKLVHFRSLESIWDKYFKAVTPELYRAGRKTHTPKSRKFRRLICPVHHLQVIGYTHKKPIEKLH